MEQSTLKYVPSQAQIDIGFWTTLSKVDLSALSLEKNRRVQTRRQPSADRGEGQIQQL